MKKIKAISAIRTADEARQIAISWQERVGQDGISYADLAFYSEYFKKLAVKFNLTKEFQENGIL